MPASWAMRGSGSSARSMTTRRARCFSMRARGRPAVRGIWLRPWLCHPRGDLGRGADALGIDLSADQIAEANELGGGKTEFRVGSVYDHHLPPAIDGSYSRWLLTGGSSVQS